MVKGIFINICLKNSRLKSLKKEASFGLILKKQRERGAEELGLSGADRRGPQVSWGSRMDDTFLSSLYLLFRATRPSQTLSVGRDMAFGYSPRRGGRSTGCSCDPCRFRACVRAGGGQEGVCKTPSSGVSWGSFSPGCCPDLRR